MNRLQAEKRLNKKLEFLPDDETLLERQAQGKGLTRPELSVLISYAKAVLKEDLSACDIWQDEYMTGYLQSAFPLQIAQRFPAELLNHRLRREIVATQVANDMVNTMGISFAQRLIESTGATVADVARAYIIARDIYAADDFLTLITQDDYHLPAPLQLDLINNMVRNIRRASRWFLRNRRSHLHIANEVAFFANGMKAIAKQLDSLLLGQAQEEWLHKVHALQPYELPEEFIGCAAMPADLYSGLSIIEAARMAEKPLENVAELYFTLGEYLSLSWFSSQISQLKVNDFWQAMARETYMNDLESQLRCLTVSLIQFADDNTKCDALLERWSRQHHSLINRWKSMVNELQAASGTDFAMFSVALRDLLDLSQATQHAKNLAE
jgi:glutamate dehydrogenase